MRILYLEDEPLDAKLVERYVKLTGHDIEVVGTIKEAKNALTNHPDVVLADVFIDERRAGYDFVAELRAGGYVQPIIAITGLAMPDDVAHCYEVGCTEVLTKPYEIQQLARLLSKYLTA